MKSGSQRNLRVDYSTATATHSTTMKGLENNGEESKKKWKCLTAPDVTST